MKSYRTKLLTSFALMAAISPGMCFATSEEQSISADDVGTVTTATGHTIDQTSGAEVATEGGERKRAAASNFLPIVRGRFPLLLVHAVRFNEALGKMGNKDVAAKMATSVGKIFDIRKGRNFAYLTKDYKPSASDVADAKAWAEQIGKENAKGLAAAGDAKLVNDIVAEYEGSGLATAEETAKFAASKPKTNFGGGKKAADAPAASGNALPGAATETSKAGNADDLLA